MPLGEFLSTVIIDRCCFRLHPSRAISPSSKSELNVKSNDKLRIASLASTVQLHRRFNSRSCIAMLHQGLRPHHGSNIPELKARVTTKWLRKPNFSIGPRSIRDAERSLMVSRRLPLGRLPIGRGGFMKCEPAMLTRVFSVLSATWHFLWVCILG